MTVTLTIGGVNRSSILFRDTFAISDHLGQRNTCSFTLRDKTGTYRPECGQVATVTVGGTTHFAGTIDDTDERQRKTAEGWMREFSVPCVDYCQIADRFTVAKIYENQLAGDIVKDVVATFFTVNGVSEGVTTVHVEDGPLIVKVVFNYIFASEAFDELCEAIGYSWYIDYDKDLHFFARETNAAPFAISDASQPIRDVKVRRTRSRYRNKQYVRAGQDISDERTETKVGDGTNKVFSVALPLAEVPTVKVNDVEKTVGIRQVETGKDWYWSKGEREITQDDGAGALIATDTLAVTYKGRFPIAVVMQLSKEIDARKAVEGGTGIYEAVEDTPNIDKRDMAIDRSNALLRKYGEIPEIVTFETDEAGLRAGQLISIELTEWGLSGEYLIESVDTSEISTTLLRYRVKCLSGEALGGWGEFFRALVKAGRRFVIRENEVLILARSFSDGVICSDSLTVTSGAPETRVGYALVGFSEVG